MFVRNIEKKNECFSSSLGKSTKTEKKQRIRIARSTILFCFVFVVGRSSPRFFRIGAKKRARFSVNLFPRSHSTEIVFRIIMLSPSHACNMPFSPNSLRLSPSSNRKLKLAIKISYGQQQFRRAPIDNRLITDILLSILKSSERITLVK